jgi:hypothetical protein
MNAIDKKQMKANQLSLLNASAENVHHYALFINKVPAEPSYNSRTIMLLETSLYRCCALIADAMQ